MICFSLNEPFRQEKRRADYSSAPKSRAVPLEREVAREELRRAVGNGDASAAVSKSYLHVKTAFLGVGVIAGNVEDIGSSNARHRSRGRIAVSPIDSRRKMTAVFGEVDISEAGYYYRHVVAEDSNGAGRGRNRRI